MPFPSTRGRRPSCASPRRGASTVGVFVPELSSKLLLPRTQGPQRYCGAGQGLGRSLPWLVVEGEFRVWLFLAGGHGAGAVVPVRPRALWVPDAALLETLSAPLPSPSFALAPTSARLRRSTRSPSSSPRLSTLTAAFAWLLLARHRPEVGYPSLRTAPPACDPGSHRTRAAAATSQSRSCKVSTQATSPPGDGPRRAGELGSPATDRPFHVRGWRVPSAAAERRGPAGRGRDCPHLAPAATLSGRGDEPPPWTGPARSDAKRRRRSLSLSPNIARSEVGSGPARRNPNTEINCFCHSAPAPPGPLPPACSTAAGGALGRRRTPRQTRLPPARARARGRRGRGARGAGPERGRGRTALAQRARAASPTESEVDDVNTQ